MKRILAALAVVAVFACSATALAQAGGKQAPPKSETVDFREQEISGGARLPSYSFVQVKRAAKFANRMTTRGDFLPELARSADSL